MKQAAEPGFTALPLGPDGVELRVCDHGPTLVRGARAVLDAEGREHEVTRPVVAVCRCARSSRSPWCDGTHKSVPGW